MRETTHADWTAEGKKRFGENPMDWKFVCPSCGHVASVKDWKDAGAKEGEVAFSCVGRHSANQKQAHEAAFKLRGGPCNYTGGGLFKLNPVTVVHDGRKHTVFEFAS